MARRGLNRAMVSFAPVNINRSAPSISALIKSIRFILLSLTHLSIDVHSIS